MVEWAVLEHPDFSIERRALPTAVQLKLAEAIIVLERLGPTAGRPLFDTLKGAEVANLKETRVRVECEWRFAFAFDPDRRAVILVGGNKEGKSERLLRALDTPRLRDGPCGPPQG